MERRSFLSGVLGAVLGLFGFGRSGFLVVEPEPCVGRTIVVDSVILRTGRDAGTIVAEVRYRVNDGEYKTVEGQLPLNPEPA